MQVRVKLASYSELSCFPSFSMLCVLSLKSKGDIGPLKIWKTLPIKLSGYRNSLTFFNFLYGFCSMELYYPSKLFFSWKSPLIKMFKIVSLLFLRLIPLFIHIMHLDIIFLVRLVKSAYFIGLFKDTPLACTSQSHVFILSSCVS